jgi:nucleotide-binding universal stress UspA family protein
MYSHILVPLENSPADETVLGHVAKLAKTSSARVSLIHVSDGHVARNYDQLKLAPSQEMVEDMEYLNKREKELQNMAITTFSHLAWGEPADEIIKFAEEMQCDLIAMATHGHGLVGDFVLGSVTRSVRHRTNIPVLLIRSCHKS